MKSSMPVFSFFHATQSLCASIPGTAVIIVNDFLVEKVSTVNK